METEALNKKPRGRPKKIKSIPEQVEESFSKDPQSVITEIIKEVIYVDKIIEVPKKELSGYELWAALKKAGYPQGGGGNVWENPNSFEKAYVARPEELYTHFLSDPEGWDLLRDTLARAWLQYSLK